VSLHTSTSVNIIIFNVVPARKPGRARSSNDPPDSAASGSRVEGREHLMYKSRADNPTNLTGNFNASKVIVNQLGKDPVRQSGVARSIIVLIREVDGFGWSFKAYQKHGWQIEYFCQDSRQKKDRKRNSIRRAKQGLE
jgi:hypothetical protein